MSQFGIVQFGIINFMLIPGFAMLIFGEVRIVKLCGAICLGLGIALITQPV